MTYSELVRSLVFLLVTFLPGTLPVPACRISEFPCKNGRCIRLDQYCNEVDDCQDQSDEPRYCTVCNRTYYGDTPTTYSLSLPRPKEEKLPFLCHLTFTANGRENGELVQLMFDAFEIGRFESDSLDGCPDGHMQLSELGRPFTGGFWCGSASGPAVYFTETSTVTVTIRLFQFGQHTASQFDFKLRYKFVGDNDAVVRFGSLGSPLERGEIVPGTYCSRNFYECYRNRCRIQSPNYPGMYPRNVTCYLTVRQKKVPTCKHAMISVRQDDGHKMQIRSLPSSSVTTPATSVVMATPTSLNKTEKKLRVWGECTGEKDHLVFYDGASTDDPVLVKYCGGDWLPKIVSRGPVMLVAFHSSPYSVPLSSATATSPLRGFELDVDILFSDSDSYDFARQSKGCEFMVNASHPDSDDAMLRSRGRHGFILSPRHTLPANSTCTYRFKGKPNDLVWLYFLSYSHQSLLGNTSDICPTRLRIWDGGGTMLGDHCDAPKMCDHNSLVNSSRMGRPCMIDESYISFTNSIVIQHRSIAGTALHPAWFRLRYEFIDTRFGGEPYLARKEEDLPTTSCSRVFRRVKSGIIHTPKNVFLYGRGGTVNLTCYYRVEAGPGERVQLTVKNVSFGERSDCYTDFDFHTNRLTCVRNPNARRRSNYDLTVTESAWKDVRVNKACICSNASVPGAATLNAQTLTFQSASKVMEITFKIFHMNITEDFKDVYFYAEFEMVRASDCPRKQRLRGSGGEIEFSNPPQQRPDKQCFGVPWFIEAHENKSLFLMTWGHQLPLHPAPDEPIKCHTKNRILFYSGRPARLSHVICPAMHNERQSELHIFSEEWFGYAEEESLLQSTRAPSFLIEFIARDPGSALINWLEVSRPKSSFYKQIHVSKPTADLVEKPSNESEPRLDLECPYKCLDLNACISSALWCDGMKNCPDGSDENKAHCGVGRLIFTLLPTYAILGGSVAGMAACFVILCFMSMHRSQMKKRRRLLGKDKMSAPHRVPTEEFLINSSGSLASS